MAIREDLFLFVVGQLRHGTTQAELSEMLSECVNRTRETGSAATLTLTLKILPDGDGTYRIEDKAVHKLPSMKRGATIMYGTPDGNLLREDPRQAELDIRIIPNDRPTTLKTIEDKSA